MCPRRVCYRPGSQWPDSGKLHWVGLDVIVTENLLNIFASLEDDDTDNLDKVWCFLENIRDPLNPSSGCYSDTKWSERDARFWSSLACFQAPDIEGGERASVNNRGFSNSIDRSYRPTKKPSTRPPTTTTSSTTTTTTTTRLALGEIEQYTDGEEHFYFSEYYQDYQDNVDDNSRQFDYNDGNQDNPSNNDVANPTVDDKSYTFIIGETNIPGFGREDEQQEVPVEQQTTTPGTASIAILSSLKE